MTAAVSDSATGWIARVEGEIAALAVRAGDRPLIAVATDDGTTFAIDRDGNVLDRVDAGVDVPAGIAVHPTRDQVAIGGARGHAVWQPGGELTRHGSSWSSAVTYNGRGDLAAGAGRTVLVHDDGGGAPYVSDALPSTVTGVSWTASGDRVAASAYGGVYVFDREQPDPITTHPYAGSHLAVAVSPGGRWVCSGNQDASVHIWRTADNDELEMAGYPDKVTRLAFDSTGRWLANNGAPDLTVWDFLGKGPRGRKPRMLSGHQRIADLDWRPGTGSVLASVGTEGTARVWDLTGMAAGRSRKAHRTLPVEDARAVRWLGPDAVVVAAGDGAVHLVGWPLT